MIKNIWQKKYIWYNKVSGEIKNINSGILYTYIGYSECKDTTDNKIYDKTCSTSLMRTACLFVYINNKIDKVW